MTLSNFDWTDKTSVKWFIMLPTGHEGPYSLEFLVQKNISREVKIWAEGLSSAVSFRMALENSQASVNTQVPEVSTMPEMPMDEDLGQEDDIPPPLPFEAVKDQIETPIESVEAKPISSLKRYSFLVGAILVLSFFGTREWIKSQETFLIKRATGMSPEIFDKINKDFEFQGWHKKIFFKEYIPPDMSHIWLVTSGFQGCQVTASFTSVAGKLLSVKDENVSFKTSSKLSGHIADFSNFDFTQGSKIVPGLYDMDLVASDCFWENIPAKLSNIFRPVDKSYATKMKVVLYHEGSTEFNAILDSLLRKKMDIELKNQNQEDLFWQDLQQKLQTLVAISLQIEQHFLDFLEKPSDKYQQNLKVSVDQYTKNFGRFLTDFVVANEKYFEGLEKSELSDMENKRNYEKLIRLTAKNVGMESIKIIEELQQIKKPNSKDLGKVEAKVKKQFDFLKENLNKKIIQLTEDRAQN